MKFSLLSTLTITAGLAVSQVAAAPIRIVLFPAGGVTAANVPSRVIRLGHAAAMAGSIPIPGSTGDFIAEEEERLSILPALTVPEEQAEGAEPLHFDFMKPKTKGHGCQKGRLMRLKTKWLELSNSFRQLIGLPPIEFHPHHYHHHSHSHHAASPAEGEVKWTWASTEAFSDNGELTHPPLHHPGPHHRHPKGHHHGHRHHWRHGNFLTRLYQSLSMLKPHEAPIVAFVLGAGIGALLRMFFVFGILFVRAMRAKKAEREARRIELTVQEINEQIRSHNPDVKGFQEVFVAPPDYEEISKEETAK